MSSTFKCSSNSAITCSSSGEASYYYYLFSSPGISTLMILGLYSGTWTEAAVDPMACSSLYYGIPKLKAIRFAQAVTN